MTINNYLSDLDKIKGEAYEEGMKDALNYLSDLFEGVKETDLWAQYMTSEGAK